MQILSLSYRLLVYGIYAVLCQTVALFLLILSADSSISLSVIAHRYLPLFEYPLMSLALLLSGALLIDYTILTQ